MEEFEARPDGPRMCQCVSRHNPQLLLDEAEGHHIWPLGEGGPDIAENMRWLCPTTHTKVHNLWREYVRYGETPPFNVRQRYSKYVRDLVAEGWRQKSNSEQPPDIRQRSPLPGR